MVFFSKFALLVVFLVGASTSAQAVSTSSTISNTFSNVDFKKLVIRNLKDADHTKFIDFFVNTFEEAYKSITLEKLGKTGYASKKEWLTELAKKEIEDSKDCEHKKSNYLVFYNGADMIGYTIFTNYLSIATQSLVPIDRIRPVSPHKAFHASQHA